SERGRLLTARREDLAEETIDLRGPPQNKIMTSLRDGKGWSRPADGEDLVPGAMNMDQGSGDRLVPPVQDRVHRPGDKPVVPGADHFAHDLPVPASHRQPELGRGKEFHHLRRDQFGEPEPMRMAVIGRELGRNWHAADDNGADRMASVCNFGCHDAAEGKADQDKWRLQVDLARESTGVSRERLLLFGRDPVDVPDFISWRKNDVGEEPVVRADA